MKAHTIVHLFIFIILVGCIKQSGGGSKRLLANKSINASSANGQVNGAPAPTGSSTATTTSIANSASTSTVAIAVDLTHFVDPYTGAYKSKLSLPRNYSGYLYLSGLNIGTLMDKLIKVRFRVGTSKYKVVDVDATVASIPGITSGSSVRVLAMDMTGAKFKNVSLTYDLYDYSAYLFDTDPRVNDPRHDDLYCRGLLIEDDPTSLTGVCQGPADKCLYTYAKVIDTPYYTSTLNPLTNVKDFTSLTVTKGLIGNSLDPALSCLPDKQDAGLLTTLYPTLDAAVYTYKGPFKAVDQLNWGISSSAIFGPWGLFSTINPFDLQTGFGSRLFPMRSPLNLAAGTSYLPSHGNLLEQTDATGVSKEMDGCSRRAIEPDIGHCNVTSSVEVFYVDQTTNQEVIVSSSRQLKLQLIKETTTNALGNNVLAASFSQCTPGSNTCGTDGCCFNNRCWSSSLISYCPSTALSSQAGLGASCSSDYDCQSLCCNSSMKCAPHDSTNRCNKAIGDACISREFCADVFYLVPRIVLNTNNIGCSLDSSNKVQKAADCIYSPSAKTGICKQIPDQPAPAFDPSNCSMAVPRY